MTKRWMPRHGTLALVLTAAALMGAAAAGAQDPPRQITVTARKGEFTPARIEVKAGEAVEIVLQSDDVTHGFECAELGLGPVKVRKGAPETVAFKADKPGSYVFKCSRPSCGAGHSRMRGEIVVSP
jgi:cytochrome c oxidase subunit II